MKHTLLALALTFSLGLFAQSSVPKTVAVKSFIELADCAEIDEDSFSADTWNFIRGYVASSKLIEDYTMERMEDMGAERVMAVGAEIQSMDATLGSAMSACAEETTSKFPDYNSDSLERSWLNVSRDDVPSSAAHLALIMEFVSKAMNK
ncbi:MAG: hypothetical protein HWE14_14910 [Flavobacteriia bacterium]|nr:hypothetical protein [Flavobacteriia bacterium]